MVISGLVPAARQGSSRGLVSGGSGLRPRNRPCAVAPHMPPVLNHLAALVCEQASAHRTARFSSRGVLSAYILADAPSRAFRDPWVLPVLDLWGNEYAHVALWRGAGLGSECAVVWDRMCLGSCRISRATGLGSGLFAPHMG